MRLFINRSWIFEDDSITLKCKCVLFILKIIYLQDREGIHRGIRDGHLIGDATLSLPIDV